MPLDTRTFFPAHWCSAHSNTAPRARDDNHAGRGASLRLDTLPNELLSSIATWLDKRATLALDETSQCFHTVLKAPMAIIHLERDIRHLVTPSDFANIATRIFNVRPGERTRLIRQIGNQRHQFHPSLLPNLQPALDRLAPSGTYEQLVLRLDWECWRRGPAGRLQRAVPAELPGLESIVRAPYGQLSLLIQWLTITGDAGVRQLQPEQWTSIARGLPTHGAAALFGALVTAVSASDPVRWLAVLRQALAFVEQLVPFDSAACPRLLSALASALGTESERSTQSCAQRRDLWERVLSLSAGLPDAPRQALLKPMAQYPCFELECGDMAQRGSGMVPAWQRMVDTLAPPSADAHGVADVVCALLDEVRPGPRGVSAQSMISTLLSRASALTAGERARVLQSAITFLSDYGDSVEESHRKWRAALDASDNLPLQFQALPLQTLAELIDATLEEFAAEQANAEGARVPVLWNLLFDRVMRLPEASRLAPALALANAGSEIDDPVQCTAKLIRLAETLPPAGRAHLLADLVTAHAYVYSDPQLWVRMVTLVVNLPASDRAPALAAVISSLTEGYGAMEEVSPDTASVPLGPDDSTLCIWPESEREAYRLASIALSLLPTTAVGALLEKMVGSMKQVDIVRWTLREITSFYPSSDEYKAAIVTKACASVARMDYLPVDVLEDLWPMVKSIPTGLRASALQYVRQFLAGHDQPTPWDEALARALGKLPDDDLPTANGRKRKGLSE